MSDLYTNDNLKWVRGAKQLPGLFTKVKWRNADGGNIPLPDATPLEHYQRTGANINWHEWLDESTLSKGGKEDEEQAEWEFLTIIRANRDILKNADGKVAFPNHSAKSAALEVYGDMIDIISNLPCKRSGKEKQVADYVNSQSPSCSPSSAEEIDFDAELNLMTSMVDQIGRSNDNATRGMAKIRIGSSMKRILDHASSLLTQRDAQLKESLLLYQNMCDQITKDQQEIERLNKLLVEQKEP